MQRQQLPLSNSSSEVKIIPTTRSRPQRQELNHLLGFSFAPRVIQSNTNSAPRRSTRRSAGHGIYDKQRFVNGQFRFVLKPTGDYTAHFADADIFFDWFDVLQVIIPTCSVLDHSSGSSGKEEGVGELPTCPICLAVPTAARMTKCGHVFCYPCMLHYLALADGTKWRKCPVCWDSIYAKDLKTVKWFDPITELSKLPTITSSPATEASSLSPIETVKMRLIRRPQMTTLALPRSKTWPSEAVPNHRTPWEFTPDAFTFAHFMLGSPGYIEETLQGNLSELRLEVDTLIRWSGIKKKDATDEELGIEYAKLAIKKVEEQIVKAGELKTSFVMTGRKQALRELKEIEEQAGKRELDLRLPVIETSSSEMDDLPIEFLSIRNNGDGRPVELSSEAPSFIPGPPVPSITAPVKPRPRRNVNPPPPADTTFFFYQAASGQNIFLDGLDIKLLKSHFGSYSLFPETIEVEILGKEEGTMNEDLSKRCRYLSHLSTGSDIIFLEADLSKLVGPKTLETFAPALKFRKNKRRDKIRREDKAKTISEQREIENRPQFMQGLSTASSSYVFSHSNRQEQNPYTSMPYAGFLESANFPSSLPAINSTTSTTSTPPTGKKTVWGTNSFNDALHASSRVKESYAEDDGYDEQWQIFEESNGRRGGIGRASGSAGGSNAGGGIEANHPSGKKKKNKKLVLNLSGGGARGA